MRASLIIAAHNESDRLWRTVASCVETSAGLDCEIIVADDASWDDSVEETLRRFPQVRVVRHDERKGASPTKGLGARHARGEVLIFLDGHTKPEPGAIQRLIEDVERLNGDAIVTPTVTGLCVTRWKSSDHQQGHGYSLELERLDCAWLPLSSLRPHPHRGRLFYESPALIGCAFAVHRELYDDLRGFDPHLLCWGVEDLDFGLKCWLMGHPILHDPEAVIGHRFQQRFDNFEVPIERLLVNQLRMARKNFTEAVWSDWIERCRRRYPGKLSGHPEGLWARAWNLFGELRASVEHERAYLLARRVHDEFWFAERFDLPWPRLQTDEVAPFATATREVSAASEREPEPSPTPGLIVRLDKLVGYAVAAPGSGSSSGGPPPTPSEGPLDANVGDTVHIDALPNPSTGTFNPAPTWAFMQLPDGSQVSLNPPANPTPGQESREFVPDIVGLYIVYANAQHPEDGSFENDSIEINVHDSGSIVRLDKLVGYVVPEAANGSSSGGPPPTPSEGPLDANVGDTVHVDALPNPSTGTFNPAPTWAFLQLPDGSQVSLTPPANPTPGQESREFVPDVPGLYSVYANAQHPEDNTFENDFIEINVSDNLSVRIDFIDANFAPGTDRMRLRYSILPEGATAETAKLEIFKDGDLDTPIFVDDAIPRTGTDINYMQDAEEGWDGYGIDEWVTAHDSPYVVRVSITASAPPAAAALSMNELSSAVASPQCALTPKMPERSSASSQASGPQRPSRLRSPSQSLAQQQQPAQLQDQGFVEVLVHDVQLLHTQVERVYMNNPETTFPVSCRIRLKARDGSAIANRSRHYVTWTFKDPGDDNALYIDGAFISDPASSNQTLGKRVPDGGTVSPGWISPEHWKREGPPVDYYKSCMTRTDRGPGANDPYGFAKATFLPSGVGGDNFVIKAEVRKQGTVLAGATAMSFTVWREVTFEDVWEMVQVFHVSTSTTSAMIQPFYDSAFVRVNLPNGVNKLPDDLSVKYVGLWQPMAPYQQNWNAIKQPRAIVNHTIQYGPDQGTVVDSEIIPPTELLLAVGFLTQPPDPAAQLQIRRRAQAWMERILSSYNQSFEHWKQSIPSNCLVGIEYYHPKISADAGEAVTNFWPDADWMWVTEEDGDEIDPDGGWTTIGGRTDDMGSIVTIPVGGDEQRIRLRIVHEIGHATARDFKRVSFTGARDPQADSDHTPMSVMGLMQAMREEPVIRFDPRESEILRGYDKNYPQQ